MILSLPSELRLGVRADLEVVGFVKHSPYLKEQLVFSVKQLLPVQLQCCHSVFIRIHCIIQIL